MVQAFFVVLFILSMTLTIVLIAKFSRHISVYYVLLFSSIVVENLGYMQLYSAKDLQSALFAHQITYFPASFIPFFALMCVTDLCEWKPPKFFQGACIALSCILFAFASTVGSNQLYYKTVELVQTEHYSYLAREYGPYHIIYPVYIIVMMLLAMGTVFLSFRKRGKISYITGTVLALTLTSLGATYIIEHALNSPIDFLPGAFVFTQIGILILLRRISLYDISGISGAAITSEADMGIVMFSANGRFTGANKAARGWFPELNSLFIDYKLSDPQGELLTQIEKWMKGDLTESVLFERNGAIIEAKYKLIRKASAPIHFISLRNDTKNQKYLRLVEDFNSKLEAQVNEKTNRLIQVQDDILISMASIVENRDNNTGGHIHRTTDIVRLFVKRLLDSGRFPSLTPDDAERIVKAAALHDFGKIAIPDVILNKPGKFTPEEYEEMKKHSEKGAIIVERILKNSDDERFKTIAVNVAHYHHEKWNGEGYPTGISGTDIPFEARIMALADVFDALVSKRVYKDSFGYDKAFGIIKESAGEHFDPQLCEEFLKCRPQLEELFNSYSD